MHLSMSVVPPQNCPLFFGKSWGKSESVDQFASAGPRKKADAARTEEESGWQQQKKR